MATKKRRPPPLPAKAEAKREPLSAWHRYEAYRARKALNAAVPPPTWVQLDDVERAAWEAAAALE